MENLKFKISLLQQENIFIKSELNKKQQIIEKLLNINSNQSLDYNKNNNNNTENDKNAFNLKYKIKKQENLKDANKKINNVNRKSLTRDNNCTPSILRRIWL